MRLKSWRPPDTPPKSISILLYDLAKKWCRSGNTFTGDTLFIGDVGRPDLMASIGISANELAGMLYDSLQNKILPLPDETLVYPAHRPVRCAGNIW
ncbi:MAG: hypothetical protein KIT39_18255 [Nitrospirales bacterium]|nr:hypothetical protein [Nitrospirales bacterium]